MLIAALVNDSFRARLLDASKEVHGKVVPAQDWDHLEKLLHEEPISIVVADPLIEHAIAATRFASILRRWASTPAIAYCHLTQTTAQALVLLSRQGLRDVVFSPYDDHRVRFSYALRRAMAYSVVSGLRNSLAQQLQILPVDLAYAIDQLLDRPYLFQSGADLVTASTLASSTVHRHLQQARLGTPRRLFLAARVAHAAVHLRNEGLRIQDVAKRLRYSRAEILIHHSELVLGLLPAQLRSQMVRGQITNEILIARLYDWIQLPTNESYEPSLASR